MYVQIACQVKVASRSSPPGTPVLLLLRAIAWALVALCVSLPGRAVAEGGGSAADGRRELLIRSTTDRAEAAELLAGFRALYPDIAVRYTKIVSGELFDEIAKPSGAPDTVADVVWSSAMDLQIKLANDGLAAAYRSPEADGLPAWAQWKDLAYGVTAEPVVIVYNKRLLRGDLVPRDHADLVRILTEHRDVFQGRIATYDPETSGTGLLFITQDARIIPQIWKLVAALGRTSAKLYTSSTPMIDRVLSGEFVLAYNVLGAYALERARQDHDLGIVFPADYTLVMTRIALIPRAAPHPEDARRFIDYMLSRDGQARLAAHSLGAVRTDMSPAAPGASASALRPIALNIDLLTYLDRAKRARFLAQWAKALQGQ
ncbi:ABC transporter substrate-binding protein [Bradyrhizobium sp. U87765 SZCCT0131]|nr:ABC transporter substrate-binding protein [Bradyrhizobium sp. U87765 SZCCT0131]MBR1261360.1 ABC transporter substrate-binding protein [Bradyrhizobium sp. U87765 SZCCT0134]MBR1303192.1 ABC transporter substrate-binding protein [Bradyrhizobium sp. U87765 SZCCT0110]MBR1318798.1 ABC transporter substrate-binding protein [Bradyrhizobium sp. U87765 SZCCT0109]MBR1347123.1 ABC transporter substrate-binding protein [Bradyrhizobium sp. U87765 SZCCT0048]